MVFRHKQFGRLSVLDTPEEPWVENLGTMEEIIRASLLHKVVLEDARPFETLNKIGYNAVRLKVFKTWKCHNVFNVSLLELYCRSQQCFLPADYHIITEVEAEKYGDDAGVY